MVWRGPFDPCLLPVRTHGTGVALLYITLHHATPAQADVRIGELVDERRALYGEVCWFKCVVLRCVNFFSFPPSVNKMSKDHAPPDSQ